MMGWLPPVLVAFPLAAAALLVAGLDRLPRRIVETVAIGVGGLTLAGVATIAIDVARGRTDVIWLGDWHPGNVVGLGIAFAIDPMSGAVATIVAGVVLAATIFSHDYFDEVGAVFYILLLAMLGAMLAFAFAADAFDMFVFYEVFSVAAYALAAYRIEQRSAFAGALQFALVNTVAGLCMLLGIVLLEGRTGELNLAAIGHALIGQHAHDALPAVSFALVAVGLLTRGALAPLHFWYDEVHASAPTPLCAILSGAMTPLALYGLARFWWTTYATVVRATPVLEGALLAIGAVSAIVGSLMCLREPHLKRALAYACVAHAGVAVDALGRFRPDALSAAALYVIVYALGAAGVFMGIAILRRHAGSVDLRRLRGAGHRLPLTAIACALGTLDLTGIGAAQRGLSPWLVVIVGAATGGAFARAFARIFGVANRAAGERDRVPWFMLAPSLVLTALPSILLAGGAPGFVARAAARFCDRAGYAAALMGHAAAGTGPASPLPVAEPAAAMLTLAGAAGVAALAGGRTRALAALRVRLQRDAALCIVARLHDGDAAHYIAWIVAAAVALAACALPATAA